jgi:hypothetical protein
MSVTAYTQTVKAETTVTGIGGGLRDDSLIEESKRL